MLLQYTVCLMIIHMFYANWVAQSSLFSHHQDTLLLLLKSLPMGCYFNIYGFGSRFEHFFPLVCLYILACLFIIVQMLHVLTSCNFHLQEEC